MTRKIKPSELEAEAHRLIREGQMPTLDELLTAIAELREKYAPLIVAARKEPNGTDAE